MLFSHTVFMLYFIFSVSDLPSEPICSSFDVLMLIDSAALLTFVYF